MWKENYAYSTAEKTRMMAEYKKYYKQVVCRYSYRNSGAYIIKFRYLK